MQPLASQVTVFILTIGDPVFDACRKALDAQQASGFVVEVIDHVSPFNAAAQEMITRCKTHYFIQVDEDMILSPQAVSTMVAAMEAAPDDVGMICFHLYDDDRQMNIQGVKIYRCALMQGLSFQNVKASEMDILDQMGRCGVKWILHPSVMGRHGTSYSIESIYLRYKTMYEKDIRTWNVLTSDVRRKAEKFRETGDLLQLFALLGAVHGIVNAPYVQDQEKDFHKNDLKELEVFKRLFAATPPITMSYDADGQSKPLLNPPVPFEQVKWTHTSEAAASMPAVMLHSIRGIQEVARPRILLATPLFWPSIGGVETIVERLGVELLAQGYAVDVATIELPHRLGHCHRGMTIVSLSDQRMRSGVSLYAIQLQELVMSAKYRSCIVFSNVIDIFIYALANMQVPPQTRLLIQPIINKEAYDAFVVNPVAKRHLGNVLRLATAAISLTHAGFDDRLMREENIEPTYLPNAVEPPTASGNFRAEHGIPADDFLILHVANLFEVKNHLGLLCELDHLPAGMKLVMIGHVTTDQEYSAAVQQELVKRCDVLYIPGMPPDHIASAMEASDVVVLASHAEASPVCILEAMSHRKAWLATPECGAVTEHAGGIVTPLKNFSRALVLLKERQDLLQALGEAGYAHWKSCYQWNVVIKGWVDLIETGQMQHSCEIPEDLARRMEALTQVVCGALANGSSPLSEHTDKGAMPIMSLSSPEQASSSGPTQQQSNAFYKNLFVKTAHWSTSYPNPDEAARWAKIAAFLEYILRTARKSNPTVRLRMIEVGCGRGWLTNLASSLYGTCEGIEPVEDVIDYARRLFPHLQFETGTVETVLGRPDFAPYDVVLCSEVIEHVPRSQKAAFISSLRQLLKPGGHVVMTTPRGELWEQWKKMAMPSQPVEDWLTEPELESLLASEGLRCVGVDRVYLEMPILRFIPAPTPAELRAHNVVPIYQVWACEWPAGRPATISFNRKPMVSVIVPTHNRPDRLRTALSSILQQTFQDFEVIVVNDGTEPVEAVVSEMNREGRITLVTHDHNRGLAASRNTGLRSALGKYVCYLDDDDRLLPDHLGTLVARLEVGDCKVAYTDAWRVHERVDGGRTVEVNRDRPYSEAFNPHQLLIGNYIPVLCVMHERACLDECGIFDESLFVHEDWDLWIRLATRFVFAHIPQTTAEFTWRTDGSSMTSRDRDAFRRTTEIIYRKYAPHAVPYPQIMQHQHDRLTTLHREADVLRQTEPKRYECSIIIPAWNKVELTKQCLIALSEVTEGVSYEVIVVDNGSTDGTQEFLQSLRGDVQVIQNRENKGFAKACNQGAAAATGEHLVFLNNDTIPQRGWLRALVDEVNGHQDVAIVGSKLLYQDRTIQHAGVGIDRVHFAPYLIYRGFAEDHPAVNHRRELHAVTGACMLVRRNLFQDLKGFDESYRNGFEDIDFCLRVRERQGTVVYQPRSIVIHLEGQTASRKDQEHTNYERFQQRWGKAWWIVDSDRLYAEDGYKQGIHEREGKLTMDLYAIEDHRGKEAWELVAAMQRAAGQRNEAAVKQQLEKYAEWPADRWVLKWAASVAEALAQPVLAEAFRQRVADLDDPMGGQIAKIREALGKGQMTAAAAQLDSLLSRAPTHAEGLLVKAILHMQREQYHDAEIAFATALNQGADRRRCLLGMGMASMGRAYMQGAWERFLQVLAEYPDDAEAIHWLLRAGTAQNRWVDLREVLRAYLARNPGDLAVRFALAGVLVQAGRIDEARKEHEMLHALEPAYDGLPELDKAISDKETPLFLEAVQR